MFAVNREYHYPFFPSTRSHKLTARNKRLFICERYIITDLDRRKGRLESRNADDTVEHLVALKACCGTYALFAAENLC